MLRTIFCLENMCKNYLRSRSPLPYRRPLSQQIKARNLPYRKIERPNIFIPIEPTHFDVSVKERLSLLFERIKRVLGLKNIAYTVLSPYFRLKCRLESEGPPLLFEVRIWKIGKRRILDFHKIRGNQSIFEDIFESIMLTIVPLDR